MGRMELPGVGSVNERGVEKFRDGITGAPEGSELALCRQLVERYERERNVPAIEMLAESGARVTPAEPGIARIELDIPARVDDLPDSYLHRVIAGFAARLLAAGGRAVGR